MSDFLQGKVEAWNAPRFLCHARWRCTRCDSPWFAAASRERAKVLLARHLRRGCRP